MISKKSPNLSVLLRICDGTSNISEDSEDSPDLLQGVVVDEPEPGEASLGLQVHYSGEA